jgi:hypothetical protein
VFFWGARCAAWPVVKAPPPKKTAALRGRMVGDVDEEVGDNDENALVRTPWIGEMGGAASWWDSHCANVMSSDWIKGASQCGFICESSEITSTATSLARGKSRTLEFGKSSASCRD